MYKLTSEKRKNSSLAKKNSFIGSATVRFLAFQSAIVSKQLFYQNHVLKKLARLIITKKNCF